MTSPQLASQSMPREKFNQGSKKKKFTLKTIKHL